MSLAQRADVEEGIGLVTVEQLKRGDVSFRKPVICQSTHVHV